MTNGTIVVGNGPIEFMDSDDNDRSVPLSALEITTSGQVGLKSDWMEFAGLSDDDTDTVILKGLLAELQREGYLRSAPPPAPKPAMILKAANPGREGDNITIKVSEVPDDAIPPDPSKTTLSITAKETDEYEGLTLANIKTKVGTDQEPKGTGLVHVTGTVATDGLPDEIDAAHALELGPGAQQVVEVKDKDDNSKTLFKLEPRGSLSANDPKVKVEISNVDDTKKTFTLTATWEKTIEKVKSDLATVKSTFEELEYLVTLSGAYSVPKVETPQSLSGGGATAHASLTLFANQQ